MVSEEGRRNSSSPSLMGAVAKTPRPRSPVRTSSVGLHSAPRSQHQSRRFANVDMGDAAWDGASAGLAKWGGGNKRLKTQINSLKKWENCKHYSQ